MRIISNLLLFSSIYLLLQGCAITHKFGPYRGQVLDAETEEPIEGAVIYFEFFTKYSAIVDAGSSYVTFREVLTNNEGKFQLTYNGLIFRPGHFWDWQPRLCVFKPGYATYPRNQITTISPKPDYGPITANTFFTIHLPKLFTIKERRKNLRRIFVNEENGKSDNRQIIRLKNIEQVNVGLEAY